MNFLFRLRLLPFLAAILCAGGCVAPVITPQADELRRVHELYVDEFAQIAEPGASQPATATSPAPGDAFARSLRAIHDFRLSHPGATQELAHLKVLEGMIYLQSGRFGLAAAVAPEVAEAGQHLRSTDGRAPRDALFAKNFPALLAGWQATRAEQRDWRTFQTSADAISESLRQVQQLPPEQRARIEADEGALYLATTAAVFYTWAAREIALSHDRAEAPAKIREWYRSAHDLIGAFLTPAEKAAHIQQDLSVSPNATPPQGRLRYIDWYHWLGRALNSPPSPAAPSR